MRPIVPALCLLAGASALAQTRPALNDARGVFDGMSFSLPDVESANDAYTIVMKVGEKETTMKLPPGVTGLRLARRALPAGEWTWSFFLQPTTLPRLAVVEPANAVLPVYKVDRDGGKVFLFWACHAEAKGYKVTVVADRTPDQPAADWGKEAAEQLGAAACTTGYVQSMKGGDHLKWKVAATGDADIAIAESEYRELRVEESWSKTFAGHGIKLQRSDTLSPNNVGKPALFGYQSSQKERSGRTTSYLTEFALIWEPSDTQFGQRVFHPRASFEAKLTSSGNDKANDAVKLRLGAYASPSSIESTLAGNLKYDVERRTGTKKGSFELAIAPAFGPFAQSYPRRTADRIDPAGNWSRLPPVSFTPTVLLGAELGRTFDTGASLEARKTFARARADLRFDVQLNFLAEALRSPEVTAYAESTYWRLWHADVDAVTYSRTGLSFKLTKEASLELTYAVGRDSPTFSFTRTGAIGLGVQLK